MKKTATLVSAIMFLAGAASALSPGADIVVPAAISAGGAGGSFWIMDLFLDNPGDKLARVDVYWLARGQDNSTAEPTRVVVPANGTVVLEDVVSNTLGVQGVGALRLRSNVLVGATARFVNTVSQAGQGFEGIDYGGRVESNEWVRIAGLREGDGARSNLFGVAGGDGVTYEVQVFDSNDAQVGSTTRTLLPWEAGFDSVSSLVSGFTGDVRATIRVTAGSGWFVGSRVDGADSITLPALASNDIVDPSMYAGNYSGSWFNTSFLSSGGATIEITVNMRFRRATMTIDLNGNVFGGVDPPPDTFSGSIDSRGWDLHAMSPSLGEVHFYITPDGLIYGMSENVPSPSIESVTYNGRIEDGKIMIQSLIRFPGGSAPAQSYLEVTRR